MRILVTNDDGIDAIGLHVLARRLTELGDVVVAAPDREYSGAGAALGALHLIRPGSAGPRCRGGHRLGGVGPTALCVTFARLGAFGDGFDLVVAGINPGANTGRAIYHSGTVGAALTARNGDLPGLAVSQAVAGFGVEGQGWDAMIQDQQWDAAAEVGARVAAVLLARPAGGDPPVLNVNVPNLPLDQVAGWRRTEVATLPPRALVQAELVAQAGHEGAYDVNMQWGDPVDLPVDTDSGAVEAGYVSITALSRIADHRADDLADVTAALELLL
jgi:5'-nucleotidase